MMPQTVFFVHLLCSRALQSPPAYANAGVNVSRGCFLFVCDLSCFAIERAITAYETPQDKLTIALVQINQ
jgi:hypothetical protein